MYAYGDTGSRRFGQIGFDIKIPHGISSHLKACGKPPANIGRIMRPDFLHFQIMPAAQMTVAMLGKDILNLLPVKGPPNLFLRCKAL